MNKKRKRKLTTKNGNDRNGGIEKENTAIMEWQMACPGNIQPIIAIVASERRKSIRTCILRNRKSKIQLNSYLLGSISDSNSKTRHFILISFHFIV
jgi:hypothetical protein